ncbi:MAG: nucleoside monophosphate kinase [Puniceicoccales bacterium]|jgi:adenylate kinase|nr:nucleoside monophosphate kinase [Puniceicoccales bacterium]
MNLTRSAKIWGIALVIFGIGNMSAECKAALGKGASRMINRNIVDMEKNEDAMAAYSLFQRVWEDLCSKFGEKNLKFPRQIIFLNGAPGAGKGTNTITVMRVFEISSKPVEVSSLLTTPECEELKEKGMLVGDDIVIAQIMREILRPANARGIIIDGFPRTTIQAYFLKILIDRLAEDTGEEKPVFKMVNFSVSQQTSVSRQLFRGTTTIQQNQKASKLGQKQTALRATDMSEEAASLRYQLYKKSISECIEILRDSLDFFEIDSEGTFEEVRNRTQDTLSGEKSL